MQDVFLIAIAPLLVLAAYCDVRHLRIPDVISVAMVGIFAVSAFVSMPDDLGARLAAAGGVFAVGFVAFAARLVGGGDVKLLSALMLFVASDHWLLFANILSVALLVGVAGIVAARSARFSGAERWKSLVVPRAFPMAVSIAMAGLSLPVLARLV